MTAKELFRELNELIGPDFDFTDQDLEWLMENADEGFKVDPCLMPHISEELLKGELEMIAYANAKQWSYIHTIVQNGEEIVDPNKFNFEKPAIFVISHIKDHKHDLSVYLPIPF